MQRVCFSYGSEGYWGEKPMASKSVGAILVWNHEEHEGPEEREWSGLGFRRFLTLLAS